MTKDDRDTLLASIMAGLPGAYDRYSLAELRRALDLYQGMDHAALRANYHRFLTEIIPTAAELGMRMCVHPDDPPRDILGLPRIVSTKADIAWILDAVDESANGVTLCSGSLGAHPDNDVPQIARQFAHRINPSPGAELSVTEPPSMSQKLLTMASPRPVPPKFTLVLLSA